MPRVSSDDLIDFTGIAERTGEPASKIRVWYLRGKFTAVRPDLKPPVFLWSKVSKQLGLADREETT